MNVGSLFVSTSALNDEDFMAGLYRFESQGSQGAWIINYGTLNAASGGMIGLLAGQVENHGTIDAELGHVILATGKSATLDFDGTGTVQFAVDEALVGNEQTQPLGLVNLGKVSAEGGKITLDAKVAQQVFTEVVNNEGVIQANQYHAQDGVIHLTAQGGMSSKLV